MPQNLFSLSTTLWTNKLECLSLTSLLAQVYCLYVWPEPTQVENESSLPYTEILDWAKNSVRVQTL